VTSRRAGLLTTALSAALGWACHRAPPESAPASDPSQGTFEYWASLNGREMRGIFGISGSVVVLNANGGTCQQSPRLSAVSPQGTVYECHGVPGFDRMVSFFVSVRRPMTESTWHTQTTTRKSRQVCAVSVINSAGREICQRYRAEWYDADVWIGGKLLVRKTVDDSSRPHAGT
jgi:hypothetical protein